MSKRVTKSTTAEKERRNSGQFGRGNVYRFKPGVSGNPAGRPKYRTLGGRWLAGSGVQFCNSTRSKVASELIRELLLGGLRRCLSKCTTRETARVLSRWSEYITGRRRLIERGGVENRQAKNWSPAHNVRERSLSTLSAYNSNFKRYVRSLGAKRVHHVTPADISKILESAGKRKEAKSMVNLYALLRVVFDVRDSTISSRRRRFARRFTALCTTRKRSLP